MTLPGMTLPRMTLPCTATLLAAATLYAGSSMAVLAADGGDFYGTTEPFASEAIYFVMIDRFVNGDPSNDHRQGGRSGLRTRQAGGAAKRRQLATSVATSGHCRQRRYIHDMGAFGVGDDDRQYPDQAFTGGDPIGSDGLQGPGKTGYHGTGRTSTAGRTLLGGAGFRGSPGQKSSKWRGTGHVGNPARR